MKSQLGVENAEGIVVGVEAGFSGAALVVSRTQDPAPRQNRNKSSEGASLRAHADATTPY